jgi:hypothetical protein
MLTRLDDVSISRSVHRGDDRAQPFGHAQFPPEPVLPVALVARQERLAEALPRPMRPILTRGPPSRAIREVTST